MSKRLLEFLYSIYKSIRNGFESLINIILFWYFGVDIDGKADYILGILTIRTQKTHTIHIGEGVKLHSGQKYNIIGGDTRLIFRTFGDGNINIGKRVGISNSSFVSSKRIDIEDDVFIGGSCKFWDTDFHSLNYTWRMEYPDTHVTSAPIVVKKGAFIGANSIILKGTVIGEKSIIGAGSVVTGNIPDGEVWGGNPVRFIKKLPEDF